MRYNGSVPLYKKAVTFLLPAGVSLLFLTNLCNLLFQCGCRSWWLGAAVVCNIQTPGASHCPWCSYGQSGFLVPLVGIWVIQVAISFVPGRFSWANRMVFSLAAFPVIGGLIGFVFAVYSDYPTFLFLRLG